MYYISSNDKSKIAVNDLNPNGIKTVVFIHGWPLSHKMFEYQTHPLLTLGYRVVSIDLRGFGDSDETVTGYNYNQMATDVYCVIRALNLNNFTLVGFSMGGAIAIRYIALYKGYGVNKLALWDAAAPSYSKAPNNPYGASIEDTNKLIALGYKDRPSLNQYFGTIFFAKEHVKALIDWFGRISDDASPTGQMKSLISLRDEDVFNDFKYIKVPTGIFHGKLDKICAYDMAKIQNENILYSKLYTFEQSGHGAFYDELELFTRTFIDFLEG